MGGLLPRGRADRGHRGPGLVHPDPVGVGLLPVPLRNPALLAMELATVARLWPDRLVATLGHGVLEWMGQVGAAVEFADDAPE